MARRAPDQQRASRTPILEPGVLATVDLHQLARPPLPRLVSAAQPPGERA